MAKKQTNRMDEVKIKLNKLFVDYVITKDESLLPLIKDLEAKLDYFNYGIKQKRVHL
jgi:hypothetical protein